MYFQFAYFAIWAINNVLLTLFYTHPAPAGCSMKKQLTTLHKWLLSLLKLQHLLLVVVKEVRRRKRINQRKVVTHLNTSHLRSGYTKVWCSSGEHFSTNSYMYPIILFNLNWQYFFDSLVNVTKASPYTAKRNLLQSVLKSSIWPSPNSKKQLSNSRKIVAAQIRYQNIYASTTYPNASITRIHYCASCQQWKGRWNILHS